MGELERPIRSEDCSKDDTVQEFIQLYSSHNRRIYGYILCFVPNWADADDLMQDTCAVLWSKFPEYTPGSSFIKWALRVTRLVIANHQRKAEVRKRTFSLKPELLESIAVVAESNNVFDQDAHIDALQHCVSLMKDKDRKLLHWRYTCNESVKTISQAVGRSMAAVYKSLSRIHFQLLVCIERHLRREKV